MSTKQFQKISDTHKQCPICGFACPIYISEPIVHQRINTNKLCSNTGNVKQRIKNKNYVSVWRRLRFFPQFCFTYIIYFIKLSLRYKSKATLTLKVYRLNICLACDDFYDEDTESCFACGCFVDKKSSMLRQECPVGKW